MGLLDEIATLKKGVNACGVGLLLKELSEKESQALIKAIDNPENSMARLEKVLANNGYLVGRKALIRHRKRGQKEIGCVCLL